MTTLRLAPVLAAIGLLISVSGARAAEPANFTYSPAPPGTIVKSEVVYLAGEAMSSQWRAVLSKKFLGKSSHGDTFYQWYLSIYSIADTTYHLVYQSPRDGGPLSTVTKISGGDMWFPIADASMLAPVELMQPGTQQLVVQSHEMAADCGGATVAVFTTKDGKVVPAVSARNGCELTASAVSGNGATALQLSGPYYGPNAAMCCPTKPKASATLKFVNGKWTESPQYYELFVGKLPPQ